MKDSELIFGLMASLNKQTYTFNELRYLTEPFQVSVSSLRTNLSRMTGAGIILTQKCGRKAVYSFAEKGQRISRNVSSGFRVYDWSGWDETFWGVSFSVPESQSELRHTFRKKLQAYRFACLNPGFWIRPAHPQENIPDSLSNLLDTNYCNLIRFTHYSAFTAQQANTLWNLEEINHAFNAVYKVLEDAAKKLPSLSPKLSFIEKMLVGDRIVNTLFTDPLLPAQFLPSNWQGEVLREAFYQFDTLATQQSQRYLAYMHQQEDVP